jgi:short-subunit dehydrogenase
MVLRDELQGTGIGVSLLCPGTVATRLNKTAEELQAKLEDREPDERVIEGNGAALSRGADPDRVGEQVVEAMQNGQFLIITHYEWLPLVKRVHKEIEDTFEAFDRRHGVDETAVFLVEGGNPITS